MAELIKIQVLRGTEAQITSANNDAGKPYFATDTKRMFISDGTTKHFVGQASEGLDTNKPTPTTLLKGVLYHATDTGKLYICTGAAWVAIAFTDLSDMSGDLDDIADGSVYGKVKNTELSTGQVIQLRAVSAAANISGDTIKTHVEDETKHRLIEDGTNSPTVLWSGQYLKSLFDAIHTDRVRQPKVIDYVNCTYAPPTEVLNDRYILDTTTGTVHPGWDGADKGDLVQFTSTGWVIKVDASDPKNEGVIVYVDNENIDRLLVNDGTPVWERRPTAIELHNELSGLNDGDYKHLTATQFTRATVQAGNGNTLGLMSDTDKSKLDNIEAGAQVNQDITAQKGTKRTDSNPANGDAIIEADFENTNGNIGAVLKGNVSGLAGVSDKVARADHQHSLVDMDAGTL